MFYKKALAIAFRQNEKAQKLDRLKRQRLDKAWATTAVATALCRRVGQRTPRQSEATTAEGHGALSSWWATDASTERGDYSRKATALCRRVGD